METLLFYCREFASSFRDTLFPETLFHGLIDPSAIEKYIEKYIGILCLLQVFSFCRLGIILISRPAFCVTGGECHSTNFP